MGENSMDEPQEEKKPVIVQKAIPKKEAGLQWEKVPIHPISGDELALKLRQAGIRTYADLTANQQKVLGILLALSGVNLAALNKFARREK